MTILRHRLDNDENHLREKRDRNLRRFEKRLESLKEGKGLIMYYVAEYVLDIFIYSIVLENKSNYTYSSLRYYLDIGLAHFRQYFSEAVSVPVNIGREIYELNPISSKERVDTACWLRFYFIATILRDEKAKDYLLTIREGVEKHEPNLEAWADYLVALREGNSDERLEAKKRIIETGKTDDGMYIGLEVKKIITIAGNAERKSVFNVPRVKLYELVIARKEELFNQELKVYLENMKAFVERKKEHGIRFHWVDINALACCAFAHDNGIHVTVKSEYIPDWVYKAEWGTEELVF